jgi:hypothetical protein
MSIHPRYVHFPWQKDYSAQPNLFWPNVMSIAQPGYRSSALNIDSFGFRVQYDAEGKEIDLRNAREQHPACILLLGNSTSFGVGLTSDRKALGHYFSRPGSPCINLSVRGATMQQEQALYLSHRHLLPPVERIILVTGICDVTIATQPEDQWSEAVGGMHSSQVYFKQHYARIDATGDLPHLAKRKFLTWAEERYMKWPWLQRQFEKRTTAEPQPAFTKPATAADFAVALPKMLRLMENALANWGDLAKGRGIPVDVVLQPIIGWTTKPLTAIERECFDADLLRIPQLALYTNAATHDQTAAVMRQACLEHGLGFRDANLHFDKLESKDALFSDVCHLTDAGTGALATWMSNPVNN